MNIDEIQVMLDKGLGITVLENLKESIYNKKIGCEDAADLFKDKPLKRFIQYLINKPNIEPNVGYSAEELQLLQEIIYILQAIYNNSDYDTNVSDYDYDKLYEILLYSGGDDIISAPVLSNKPIVYHNYPTLRGTLDKVHYLFNDEIKKNPSRKHLDEWIASRENDLKKLGLDYKLDECEVYVFPKWDGISAILEYEDGILSRALTRGDTTTNEATDISMMLEDNYRYSIDDKIKMNHAIKTEVMMSEHDLHAYNMKYGTDYKNTRSIVASILNSIDKDNRVDLIKAIPLRILTNEGIEYIPSEAFKYPYIKCKLKDREAIATFAENNEFVHGMRTDGAVIYIIDPDIQKALGRKDSINKFEVAYKFTEKSTKTVILDIIFSRGLHGGYTPVAKVEPVKLKGNTISSISLGSMDRFNMLNLSPGDEVIINYDIIPYLTIDHTCIKSTENPFEAITHCPHCEKELEYVSDATMKCTNMMCPKNITGKILNYVNKMNIMNISFAIIDKLHSEGMLLSIADLYSLDAKAISKLDRMGMVSAKNIVNEIHSKKNTIPSNLLGSLGISDVGRRKFKKICEVYSLDDIIEFAKNGDMDKFTNVKGIGEPTAKLICEGIQSNIKLIKFLRNELNIEDEPNSNDISIRVCFTKVRDAKLEEIIKSNGGDVVNSITKDTTHLVVKSYEDTSTKVEKAKSLGIPILTLDDFVSTIINRSE